MAKKKMKAGKKLRAQALVQLRLVIGLQTTKAIETGALTDGVSTNAWSSMNWRALISD